MTQTLEGWGEAEWGDSPWGAGGSGQLALVSALALVENAVRIEFNEAPVFDGLLTAHDASDPTRYSVTAVSGVGLDGEPVRPVLPVLVQLAPVTDGAGRFLDVYVDRPFTAWPAVYQVTAVGLISSVGGAFLVPGASAQFTGVRAGKAPPTLENLVASRDLLIPQTARELEGSNVPGDPTRLVGTLPVDATGDYASGTPIAGYRTRVIRRAASALGSFAHLPQTYGTLLARSAKKPFRQSQADLVCAQIEQQVRLEPETVSVTVTASASPTGVTTYQIRAVAHFGAVDVALTR